GCAAAKSTAVAPASASAKIAARWDPTASSTATRSSLHTSQVGKSARAARSDAPLPLRSKRISRLKAASRLLKAGFRSHVPLQIEVAEAVVVDEVERAYADDLVGYLGFANGHISRLRRVHSSTP